MFSLQIWVGKYLTKPSTTRLRRRTAKRIAPPLAAGYGCVRFHMKSVRTLTVADCEEVLRINAESLPGVARLDRAEFERLLTIPNEHLAVEGLEGGLLGYLLAFRSDASYDGEEFLSFVEMASEPFIYIDQVAGGRGVSTGDAGSRRGSLASTQQAF